MAIQIGPKIGVDGEAEYRKQMARIISEANALKAEMTQLKTAVTDETTAQKNAQDQAKNLAAQLANQEERVRLLSEQLGKVTAAYGEGSTQANAYRETLANAQTTLNLMRADQQGMTGDMNDFADAEEEAGANALSMGDMIKANVISDTILGGLKTLAELGKKAAKAVYGTAASAAAYADEYLTMSTVTGLSTDQLQEFAYMSELVDVSLDTMTGSMTKLTSSMNSARRGGKNASEAFARLGIEITNEDGTLRDATDVFWEVLDVLSQMEDGTERDALAMDLFGKSAQELNPLIALGSRRLQMFAAEANAMGYVLDEETLARLGSLDDSLQRLDNLKLTVLNKLGAGMAPSVERIVDKLIELGMRVDWENVGAAVGGMLETLTDQLIRLADSGATLSLIESANGLLGKVLLWKSPEAQPGYNATVAAGGEVTNVDEAVLEYARLQRAMLALDENTDLSAAEFLEETSEIHARMVELVDEFGADIADAASALNAEQLEAYENGLDMAKTYADGITDGTESYLVPALEGMAGTIESYMHHSEPDVGPLAHDSEWMPDMLQGWARQIEDNSYLVRDAMAGLAFDLQDALRPGLQAGGGSGINYGGVNVVIYGAEGQSAAELYEEFSYRLNQDVLDREAVFA